MASQQQQPQPQSYPVSKPLWDALESALMARSRELIRDIAKTLKQDDKVLMKAFRENKKNIYLIDIPDPTEERFQCEALVPTTHIAYRCRKPVQYGERFCPGHRFWTMPETMKNKPALRRIQTEDGDIYFVDPLTQQVYTINFERIGIAQESKLILFEVESSN